jgi:hypothetical protein
VTTSTHHRAERFVEGSVEPAHLGGVVPDHWDQIGNAVHDHDVITRWARWWADKFPDDRVRIRSITTTETVEEITAPVESDQQEGLF